jgi:hypothetical protein
MEYSTNRKKDDFGRMALNSRGFESDPLSNNVHVSSDSIANFD